MSETPKPAEGDDALDSSRKQRLMLVGAGFSVVVVIAAVALVLATGGGDSPEGEPDAAAVTLPAQQVTDLKAATAQADGKLTDFDADDGDGEHTTDPVDYPMNPPTNGPHYPDWAADGNYVGRETPTKERLVHALEHGRIELQYRPGLPEDQVEALVALFDESPAHVLLFENQTGMKADVAATAWAHSLTLPTFTSQSYDAIRVFRDQYRDQGPELVP